MAGYENIKNRGFDNRTTRELREISSRGGQKSGEARKRRADFRKTLNLLLTSKIDSEEWEPILEALGLECTLEAALNMAMIKKGLAGNVKAYEAIGKYAGQSIQTEADDEEQRVRTDRAKRARDQECGEADGEDDNIRSFLRAMNPTQENVMQLFDDDSKEDEDCAEDDETAEEI